MPNAAAILLCVLALICGVFLLGGLGLLITGKDRRGSGGLGQPHSPSSLQYSHTAR